MENKCQKCGYEGKNVETLDNKKDVSLCQICKKFAPTKNIGEYVNEKIDWRELESFRKFKENRNVAGMEAKAKKGLVVNRAPYGFRLRNKKLVPHQKEKLGVEEIFRDFLETDLNLSQLADKYGFSVNGIKKVLRNFTYIGKVKFNGQIHPGKHEAIIPTDLFNKVQTKLEKEGIK